MTPLDFIQKCVEVDTKFGLGAKFGKMKKKPTVGDAEKAIDKIEPLVDGNADATTAYNELFDLWEEHFEGIDSNSLVGKTTEQPAGDSNAQQPNNDPEDPGPGSDGNQQPEPKEKEKVVNSGPTDAEKEQKKLDAKAKRDAAAKKKAELAKLIDPNEACVLELFSKLSKESINELKRDTLVTILEIQKK